jgi:hypothetical protein
MIRRHKKDHNGSRGNALRYYLYISDTKIDQLVAQVPPKQLKRIAVEAKIDLKLIQLTLKQNPVEENRISRLRIAERFIDSSDGVGTVDEPGPWIRGTLALRWGPLSGEFGSSRFAAPDVVFFIGRTPQTIIGMGGSMAHVLGAASNEPTASYKPGSATFILANYFERVLPLPTNETLSPSAVVEDTPGEKWALALRVLETDLERKLESDLSVAKLPKQTVTFLAKRLLVEAGNDEGPTAVVATPLFVALAD